MRLEVPPVRYNFCSSFTCSILFTTKMSPVKHYLTNFKKRLVEDSWVRGKHAEVTASLKNATECMLNPQMRITEAVFSLLFEKLITVFRETDCFSGTYFKLFRRCEPISGGISGESAQHREAVQYVVANSWRWHADGPDRRTAHRPVNSQPIPARTCPESQRHAYSPLFRYSPHVINNHATTISFRTKLRIFAVALFKKRKKLKLP